jgi:hypothetical protein
MTMKVDFSTGKIVWGEEESGKELFTTTWETIKTGKWLFSVCLGNESGVRVEMTGTDGFSKKVEKQVVEIDGPQDNSVEGKLRASEEQDMKTIAEFYHPSFLLRLLCLIDTFTSIATISPNPMSMIQRVANPQHLSTLLHQLTLV